MTQQEMYDHLTFVISRSDVTVGNVAPTLESLERLVRSPATMIKHLERVDLAFDGYNETPAELFEIIEVRKFVAELDNAFPFWLFFLSKHSLGLQCVLLCLLPPFLTREAKAEIFPKALHKMMTTRWFPAMNHLCALTGMSINDRDALTDRAIQYVLSGPFR